MNRKFKLYISLALVAISMVACQKDEELLKKDTQDTVVKTGVSNITNNPELLKTFVFKRYETVTDISPMFYGKPSENYKTLIINERQEWLAVDWNNRWIDGGWDINCTDGNCDDEIGVYRSPYFPNDGLYYEWPVLMNINQYDWNKLFFPSKPGFHIPTKNDIDILIREVGRESYIPQLLELKLYNDVRTDEGWKTTNYKYSFWVNISNPLPSCGVYFKYMDDQLSYIYAKDESFTKRVRLVRNL